MIHPNYYNVATRYKIFICFVIIFGYKHTLKAQTKTPQESANKKEINILMLGDNNIQNRDNPRTAYENLMPLFKEADAILMNLEGPFAKNWNPDAQEDIPHKKWTHSSEDQVLALVEAGVSAVGVANNVNYPYQALLKSLKVLYKHNIKASGGGNNLEEARKPVILERKNKKIGFIQYAATVYPSNHAATATTAGILPLHVHTAYQPPPQLDKPGQPPIVLTWLDQESKKRLEEDISQLRLKVDVLIASCHWGISGTYEAIAYQKEIASIMIDNGADLVFGHGPHRLQQIEIVDGKPVFYSIGQGVFDDPWNDRNIRYQEGLMIQLTVAENKANSTVTVIPLWRDEANELFIPRSGSKEHIYLYDYIRRVNGDSSHLSYGSDNISVKNLKF